MKKDDATMENTRYEIVRHTYKPGQPIPTTTTEFVRAAMTETMLHDFNKLRIAVSDHNRDNTLYS